MNAEDNVGIDGWVNSYQETSNLQKEDFGSNCIDQFYYEEDNKKYMFVGSFNGIYVTELTDDGLSVKRNENGTPTLKKQVCGKAFEGTNIYKKNGYYYLFASINNCCDGERSRYKVVVGRSQDLLGPYLDKSGKDMINNAWELVLEGDGQKFFGPGHNSIIVQDDADTDMDVSRIQFFPGVGGLGWRNELWVDVSVISVWCV